MRRRSCRPSGWSPSLPSDYSRGRPKVRSSARKFLSWRWVGNYVRRRWMTSFHSFIFPSFYLPSSFIPPPTHTLIPVVVVLNLDLPLESHRGVLLLGDLLEEDIGEFQLERLIAEVVLECFNFESAQLHSQHTETLLLREILHSRYLLARHSSGDLSRDKSMKPPPLVIPYGVWS